MTDEDGKPVSHELEKLPQDSEGMPGWKKTLLIFAGLALALGLGLEGWKRMGDKGAPAETSATPANLDPAADPAGLGAQPLVEGGIPAPGGETTIGGEPEGALGMLGEWSPLLWKGGFSFFVGFSIGYLLRSFFKLTALAAGLILLAMFALSKAGVVDVDWTGMQGMFDTVLARVKEESTELKEFAQGSLPSAALGMLGLLVGFKR